MPNFSAQSSHLRTLYAPWRVNTLQIEVFPFQNRLEMLFKRLRQQQVADLNAFFLIFIAVDRRDAAFCRAVCGAGEAVLLQRVLLLMKGKDDDRPVADFKIIRRDPDASVPKRLHLLAQMLQIDHRTVAEDIDGIAPEKSRTG